MASKECKLGGRQTVSRLSGTDGLAPTQSSSFTSASTSFVFGISAWFGGCFGDWNEIGYG
jgi:hypothetical protein